jgi:hypothetical protein
MPNNVPEPPPLTPHSMCEILAAQCRSRDMRDRSLLVPANSGRRAANETHEAWFKHQALLPSNSPQIHIRFLSFPISHLSFAPISSRHDISTNEYRLRLPVSQAAARRGGSASCSYSTRLRCHHKSECKAVHGMLSSCCASCRSEVYSDLLEQSDDTKGGAQPLPVPTKENDWLGFCPSAVKLQNGDRRVRNCSLRVDTGSMLIIHHRAR